MASLAEYRSVWATIKATGSASITVSNEAMKCIVGGVLKAKAIENVKRRNMGLMYWSKLEITRTPISPVKTRVEFKLKYDTKV